jgi:hypothetical protein
VNFVADENVDGPIVRVLRNKGYELVYIAELDPSISDGAGATVGGK